jgi:hypothetical protein
VLLSVMDSRRRFALATLALLMLVCVAPAGATSGGAHGVPETREYRALVASGTARFAHVLGALRITLVETRRGPWPTNGLHEDGPAFTVSITLHGDRCSGPYPQHNRRKCVSLSGSLAGTATRVPTNPDLPSVIRFTALSGHTNALGSVTASGSYRGTGFIAHGRRHISLTLHGSSGSVTIGGYGAPVSGFTSP